MSKRIALALLACAGLGYVAGRQPVLPNGSRSSEPVPEQTAVTRIAAPAPVETPSIEKMLPKKPAGPVHGTRTEDGFFYFHQDRKAWIPVDLGHPRYDFNDAPVTLEHLITEHGHARSSASKWTRDEIETAHANSHYWEKAHGVKRAAVVVQSSSCPGGVCPSPSRSRGLFRRR